MENSIAQEQTFIYLSALCYYFSNKMNRMATGCAVINRSGMWKVALLKRWNLIFKKIEFLDSRIGTPIWISHVTVSLNCHASAFYEISTDNLRKRDSFCNADWTRQTSLDLTKKNTIEKILPHAFELIHLWMLYHWRVDFGFRRH